MLTMLPTTDSMFFMRWASSWLSSSLRLLLLPPRGDVEAKPGDEQRLAVVVALDDAGFEGEPADFAGLAPPQPELVAQLTPGVERRAYRLS